MGRKIPTQSRRSVLRNTAALAVGGGVIGQTVSAESPRSAEAAGVKTEAQRLAKNGETVELLKLLRSNDVEYGSSLQTLDGNTFDDVVAYRDDSGVGTQDFFTKDKSNIASYHYNVSGDKYRIQSDVTLKAFDDAFDPDLTAPVDLYTLAYDSSRLTFEPDTITYDGPDGGEDISVREYPITNTKGLVLELTDDGFVSTSQDTYSAYLGYEVNKDSSKQGNYAGQYNHTWSVGNLSKVSGLVEYAWKGLGISVDLGSLSTDQWKLYDAEEIN